MFINAKDLIEIVLFYKKDEKGNSLKVLTDIEGIPEEQRPKYTKVVFQTRPLSFKMHNDIQRAAMVDKGIGEGEQLDWIKYKENKLLKILADWDAKDEKGDKVPVNQDNIFNLNPMIAERLLNQYDRKTLIGEE